MEKSRQIIKINGSLVTIIIDGQHLHREFPSVQRAQSFYNYLQMDLEKAETKTKGVVK